MTEETEHPKDAKDHKMGVILDLARGIEDMLMHLQGMLDDIKGIETETEEVEIKVFSTMGISPEQLADLAWQMSRELMDDEAGRTDPDSGVFDKITFLTHVQQAIVNKCDQINIQLNYDDDKEAD
jgi:hypothetical protein